MTGEISRRALEGLAAMPMSAAAGTNDCSTYETKKAMSRSSFCGLSLFMTDQGELSGLGLALTDIQDVLFSVFCDKATNFSVLSVGSAGCSMIVEADLRDH